MPYDISKIHDKHKIRNVSSNKTYSAWCAMRRRCRGEIPNHKKRYKDRGISVCEEWESDFLQFLSDMGPRPHDKDCIDRIDNNMGYSPNNCRWATNRENALNRERKNLITHNGKSNTLSGWADTIGIDRKTLSDRLKIHSVEKSLEMPRQKPGRPFKKN